jgi:hypothetical protein
MSEKRKMLMRNQIKAARIDTLDYDGLCAILNEFNATPRDNDEVEAGAESGPVMTVPTENGLIDAFDGDWVLSVYGKVFVCAPRSPAVTTHRCPPKGSNVMPCCGRTPLEAVSDRMTVVDILVTCNRSL